jgi:hypothetical protein
MQYDRSQAADFVFSADSSRLNQRIVAEIIRDPRMEVVVAALVLLSSFMAGSRVYRQLDWPFRPPWRHYLMA